MENSKLENFTFDMPKNQSNVIKVIGVGGGGSNAINYMFRQGIKGVDFVVCNTDAQALQNSPVPNKIQLGVTLTEGLGAGANPEVGQQSAIESISEIEQLLDANTKMLFITAGMGGGTGTGAAPVIAQLAREREILTVGIVTMPFQFEGKMRQEQAQLGIEKLRKQVDSLIVINNNKLREVYGNLGFKAGFSKADEVLSTASRGIAEVITHHYTQNIDLKDAKTVLANSGTAIMGSATASGDDRAKHAIIQALDSPLLNDNKISGAKNVLLLIVSGTNEITIDEIGEINDYIQAEAGFNANIIMGVGEDEKLEDAIAVTVIATGFNADQQDEIVNIEQKKIIHSLEDEQKLTQDLIQKQTVQIQFDTDENVALSKPESQESKVVFELEKEPLFAKEKLREPQPSAEKTSFEIISTGLIPTTQTIKNTDVVFEIISAKQPQKSWISEEHTEENLVFGRNTPLNQTEQKLEISQQIKEIEVNDPIEVVSFTEVDESGVKRYSLEEYMEVENTLLNSKPTTKQDTQSELNFMLKQEKIKAEEPQNTLFSSGDLPLTEMTIEEAQKTRAEQRKNKMKAFNYTFHNNPQRLEELEKEPAYKRQNIELDLFWESESGISRTSLSTDNNNEPQLRTNNSFLHDNVD